MAEKEEGLLLPLPFFSLLAILLRQFSLCQHRHLHAVLKFANLAENCCYNKNWFGSREDPASGTASARKEAASCKQEDGGGGMGVEGRAISPSQWLWNFAAAQPFRKLCSQARPKQQRLVSSELWEHTSSRETWVERFELDILGNFFDFITLTQDDVCWGKNNPYHKSSWVINYTCSIIWQ